MNIKDATLVEEAKVLAGMLGTNVTEALRQAVRVRTDMARRTTSLAARRAKLIELAVHCATNLDGPPLSSADVDTFLYDPRTGLPR